MYYYKHFKNIEGFKRILNDHEIDRFFSVIHNEMDFLFFHLMLRKGKRISELCKLKIQDIDFENNLFLTYVAKKRDENSRRITYFDDESKALILAFIDRWAADIEFHDGLIFYSQKCRGKAKNPDCFGAKFRKYRHQAGLDMLHYPSKDGRKIHHVRSHSLRATAINKILEVTDGDIFKTLAFSHHKTIEGLIPYVAEYNKRELAAMENKAFQGLHQKDLTDWIKVEIRDR